MPQQVYFSVFMSVDKAMPEYLKASVAMDKTTTQCLKGPLKGPWPKEKTASEQIHLKVTVAVDKSMPQQVYL